MDDQPRVGARLDLIVRFHVDEVQQLASTATAGTYRITHRGRTTDPILWDATSQDVEEALERLPNVGPGGVVCYGGPHPGQPIRVRFTRQCGKRSQPTLLVDATDLTGAVTVTTTHPGGPTAPDATPTVKVEAPGATTGTELTGVTDLGGGAYTVPYTPAVEGLHRILATAPSAAFGPVEAEATITAAPRTVG